MATLLRDTLALIHPTVGAAEVIFLSSWFLLQVVEVIGKLGEAKQFWSNLPDNICSAGTVAEADEEQCWNSHMQGR